MLLPPEKARSAGRALRALGVSVFVVRALPEQMLYDKTLIILEAGKPAEIILKNDDSMQHNLVVVAPGALDRTSSRRLRLRVSQVEVACLLLTVQETDRTLPKEGGARQPHPALELEVEPH